MSVDNLHAISSFLTGFDVFYLSHTNSRTLSVLSEDLYWQKRITGDHSLGRRQSWKQRYMLERSLQFVDPHSADKYIHGMLLGCNRSRVAFAKLERPPAPGSWRGSRFDLRLEKDTNFSFDVWFCLFPGTAKQPAGGVLYGSQSAPANLGVPRSNPGNLVMVDMKCSLYCSVLDEKKVIAQDLEPNRWYHVALTYDVTLRHQLVYLDGKVASSEFGSLNSMWQRLQHEQIGTGFCHNTAGSAHMPHSRMRGGWYSFYGLIDEFRVWNSVLPADAVAVLYRYKNGPRDGVLITPVVVCNVPLERICDVSPIG
ncbi:hypothetical protein PF011_g24107 [Phytophthora fragariae]|uniref:LamG-like jellyroll fold domain-containing protein n=2 Tax=Phytophthora fragariae TaxID=53985 RepID=A0A6A3I284_9STRA|nr:hypothetical protein PF003_g35859 [Phytophthora fragariae]KAE8976310.1 hypothetical protein PF011_g24107 [Phytophthora fragariae]